MKLFFTLTAIAVVVSVAYAFPATKRRWETSEDILNKIHFSVLDAMLSVRDIALIEGSDVGIKLAKETVAAHDKANAIFAKIRLEIRSDSLSVPEVNTFYDEVKQLWTPDMNNLWNQLTTEAQAKIVNVLDEGPFKAMFAELTSLGVPLQLKSELEKNKIPKLSFDSLEDYSVESDEDYLFRK